MTILQVDTSDRDQVERAVVTLQRLLRGWDDDVRETVREQSDTGSEQHLDSAPGSLSAESDEVQARLAERMWDETGAGSGSQAILGAMAVFEPGEPFTRKQLVARIEDDGYENASEKIGGWYMRLGRTLGGKAKAVQREFGLAQAPKLIQRSGNAYWLTEGATKVLRQRRQRDGWDENDDTE